LATGTFRRDVDTMTMYLPNGDVLPTGYEPAEFIESPTFAPAADPSPATPEVGDEDDETSAS
jgi:hypothetical protein